jgi:hypothetical protein
MMPNRPEADLAVGADGGGVVSGGVDHQAAVAAVDDQVPRESADSVGAQPAAVHRRVDIDVDAGVPIIGLLLGAPLDRADDAIMVLDHEGVSVGVGEVGSHFRGQVVAAAPALAHLRRGADIGQRRDVGSLGRPQGSRFTDESRLHPRPESNPVRIAAQLTRDTRLGG